MARFTLLDTQPSIHTSRTACGLSECPLAMASTSTSLLSIQSQSMTTSLCGKFSFPSLHDIFHLLMANIKHSVYSYKLRFLFIFLLKEKLHSIGVFFILYFIRIPIQSVFSSIEHHFLSKSNQTPTTRIKHK